MQWYHLGIDVAKAKLDCALRLADGKFKDKVVEITKKALLFCPIGYPSMTLPARMCAWRRPACTGRSG